MICVMSQDAETGQQRKARTQQDLRALASKSLGLASSVVRIVATIFAAVLVVHIVLTVSVANPENSITQFFAFYADRLTLGIGDLFLPQSFTLAVILNFGLAAVVWLVLGTVGSRLLNALAP